VEGQGDALTAAGSWLVAIRVIAHVLHEKPPQSLHFGHRVASLIAVAFLRSIRQVDRLLMRLDHVATFLVNANHRLCEGLLCFA
jgi:hypothetical protein